MTTRLNVLKPRPVVAFALFTVTTIACDMSEAGSLKRRCTNGDGNGCALLGDLYRSGKGVPLDPARGFALHEDGCKKGDYGGCYTIAGMLRRGEGVPRDPDRAVRLFEAQCLERKGGRQLSCLEAAGMLESGDEVPKDERRALACHRQACDSLYRGPCYRAAEMAEMGLGTAPDPKAAADYFLQSCDPSSPPRSKPPNSECQPIERARLLYEALCAKADPGACAAAEALKRGAWP